MSTQIFFEKKACAETASAENDGTLYYSEVLKEMKKIFKPIHKVTFKKFISHVKGTKGSVHIN